MSLPPPGDGRYGLERGIRRVAEGASTAKGERSNALRTFLSVANAFEPVFPAHIPQPIHKRIMTSKILFQIPSKSSTSGGRQVPLLLRTCAFSTISSSQHIHIYRSVVKAFGSIPFRLLHMRYDSFPIWSRKAEPKEHEFSLLLSNSSSISIFAQ
jgi:hypothetical protein